MRNGIQVHFPLYGFSNDKIYSLSFVNNKVFLQLKKEYISLTIYSKDWGIHWR